MTKKLAWAGAILAIVVVGGLLLITYGFFRIGGGVLVGAALTVLLVATRSRGVLRANMLDAGRILQVVLGLLFGLLYLALGGAAIFVFRNDEPASSWMVVFSGHWTTLPAGITAVFRPLIGGIWLLGGAAVSFGILAWGMKLPLSGLLHNFLWLSLPMLILAGIAFWRWRLDKGSE